MAGSAPPGFPEGVAVQDRRGAFVTLESAGALRGCIGHVPADRPLAHVVRDMAVAAARYDPRFAPLGLDELSAVRIEISALTEAKPLAPLVPECIVIGRDGLLLRRGDAMGLLLPQVAVEYGWSAVAFLAAACRKAGLTAEAWREPATRVFTFQADVFGESGDLGGRAGGA